MREDIEHPGVLVRDKATGEDIIVCWETFAAANNIPLSEFRKKHPTPWKTKPYTKPKAEVEHKAPDRARSQK